MYRFISAYTLQPWRAITVPTAYNVSQARRQPAMVCAGYHRRRDPRRYGGDDRVGWGLAGAIAGYENECFQKVATGWQFYQQHYEFSIKIMRKTESLQILNSRKKRGKYPQSDKAIIAARPV